MVKLPDISDLLEAEKDQQVALIIYFSAMDDYYKAERIMNAMDVTILKRYSDAAVKKEDCDHPIIRMTGWDAPYCQYCKQPVSQRKRRPKK